ncbi:MAG: flavin reductase family protein [Rhodospirillaceae bacterium]|nr:flavin reductase family protein [Rhodospirillaceae bacterium]
MFYEPGKSGHGLPHDPFKSLVVPRPIGWISTYAKDGTPNLAPYSFFNAVGFAPPMVIFSSGTRRPDHSDKDSALNVEETGAFVVNMVSYDLRDQMTLSAEEVDPDVDEFDLAGLEMGQAKTVNAPLVVASPAHLECKYMQTVKLESTKPGVFSKVVFGEVVGVQINDDYLTDQGRVDVEKMRPVARLGYMDYTSVETIFSMKKLMPEDGQNPGEAGTGITRKLV